MFRTVALAFVLFSFLGSTVGPAFDASFGKKVFSVFLEAEKTDQTDADSSEEQDFSNLDQANQDKFFMSWGNLRAPGFSRLTVDFDCHRLAAGAITSLDKPPKA